VLAFWEAFQPEAASLDQHGKISAAVFVLTAGNYCKIFFALHQHTFGPAFQWFGVTQILTDVPGAT
jgi:hypothetical protein